jgi:hypothetical protein
MGVDIDDQHVVEIALHRLLAGMAQKLRGVELVDCDASAAVGYEVHGVVSSLSVYLFWQRAQRPVQLCHMPSSNTARLAALSSALVVVITSVGLALVWLASGRNSRAGVHSHVGLPAASIDASSRCADLGGSASLGYVVPGAVCGWL